MTRSRRNRDLGSSGTYWGMGTFTGQPVVFGLFGIGFTVLAGFALSHDYPMLSALMCVGIAMVGFYGWIGPRIVVTPRMVTFHSWFRTVKVQRGVANRPTGWIVCRSVVYFRGAAMPELHLSSGERVLLPMLPIRRSEPSVIVHRVLRGVDDLAQFVELGLDGMECS